MEDPLDEDFMELLTEETQQLVEENPEQAQELVSATSLVFSKTLVIDVEKRFGVTEKIVDKAIPKEDVSAEDIEEVAE